MREYVTWLPDVLRDDAGVDVHVMPGAETRSNKSGPLTLNAIIWHHTATSTNWADGHVAALLRDGHRTLAGPLAQVGIERDGTWVIVAMGSCNHNGYGKYGNNSLGLEFYNDGIGEPWPEVQVESGVQGIAAVQNFLARERGGAVPLLGHKESDPKRKPDPFGLDMDVMRRRVEEARTPRQVDVIGHGVDDNMVIIQHPTGAAVAVSGSARFGVKSPVTLENFRKQGVPVVPVDDATWQDAHKALSRTA